MIDAPPRPTRLTIRQHDGSWHYEDDTEFTAMLRGFVLVVDLEASERFPSAVPSFTGAGGPLYIAGALANLFLKNPGLEQAVAGLVSIARAGGLQPP